MRIPLMLAFVVLFPVATLGQALDFTYSTMDQTVPFNPSNGIAVFLADLSIEEATGNPEFPNDTMGFAMVVEHDPLLVTVLGAFPAPFLAAICNDGPEVFIVTLDPAGCAGVDIGVVYGLTCDVFLQFPVETPVVTVSYETVPDGLIGAGSPMETDLVWTSGCGGQNAVVVGGILHDADFVNGTITLLPVSPPDFVRGDCNADGGVDVGDSIWILSELFSQGPTGPCTEACDTNHDLGRDIADAIYLLGFLFASGPAPPAPFPDCGSDPDLLPGSCESFGPCP